MRDPLRGEALDVLDGMKRGVVKELTNQAEPFMVGNVRRGLLSPRPSIQILKSINQRSSEPQGQCTYVGEIGLDNRRSDCCPNCDGIERHCAEEPLDGDYACMYLAASKLAEQAQNDSRGAQIDS